MKSIQLQQAMSAIKRWAKAYLSLSPIANSSYFFTPHNEALIEINSRLLAAYWIKMYKYKHYDQLKIKQLIQQKGQNMHEYWLGMVRQHVLLEKIDRVKDEEEEFDILKEDKEQLRQLVKQFYTKVIDKVGFTRLCQLYSHLTLLGCDRNVMVTEMDNYLIDHSFFSVDQILSFVKMNNEAALEAVDVQAISFLEKKIQQTYTLDILTFISIIEAVKNKIKPSSNLHFFYKIITIKQKYQQLMNQNKIENVSRLIISYMLWLINIKQLGPFIKKKVSSGQSFQQYYQKSMNIAHQFLKIITFYDAMALTDIIILNQIVYRLQQMQEKMQFSDIVKQHIAMEATVRKTKEYLHQKLHIFDVNSVKDQVWIDLLAQTNIDYQSSHSIGVIKKLIESLVLNPYFKIIVQQQKRNKLITICQNINSQELIIKIVGKNGIKKSNETTNLLDSLKKIAIKDEISSPNIKIRSIYQLKRIKQLLLKCYKSKVNIFTSFTSKDQILLKTLQIYFINPSKRSPNTQQTSLQLIFDEFRL